MADDLDALRRRIDELDAQILLLLNERAETALELGHFKAMSGKAAYDPTREQVVLDQLTALNEGPLASEAIDNIYRAIITACRDLQR